ncbi:head-tail joining protein [Sphingomonas panaciterrae]|uniref:head-tail joining protein n=1 Tax=Sphingomonas panaciterrae TaxID=1462999 RepID=UPI002FEFBF7B
MTTLRDATLVLERGVNDALGDEITYRFGDGDLAPITFNAWVEFDTADASTGSSASRTDAPSIEVPIDAVPLPSHADRITITVLGNQLFAMAARRRSPTGASWIIDLKRAAE